MSLFTFDVALLRQRIPSISEKIGGLAVDFAACTPDNPFDDMAALQVGPLTQSLLTKLLGTSGPVVQMSMANFDATAEGHFRDGFEAQQIRIKPETIQLIISIIKLFFPALPFQPR